MNYHLAQMNIAKILAPLDNPIMKDFVDNLDRINGLAEASDGFVWRLKDESNSATNLRIFDDDMIIVNLSLWASVNALMTYIYKTDHAVFLKRKKEWFEKMPDAFMALWYIPENTTPTLAEAVARLEYLKAHGDTPYAFTFRKKYTSQDATQYNP
ncbi:MAG: DUF3291 domain-containing protein [Chryseolinea sp.]